MITDNLHRDITDIESLKGKSWEILKTISHCSVEELCDTEKGLLVFPHCLDNQRKEFRKSHILKISHGKISIGNLVGFISVTDKDSNKNIELTIRSRFQKNEDSEDYFLHYMLQRVFNITVLDLKHSSTNEDIFDFAMYLFPHYLKRAMKQGLFRQYRKYEYNDANVRGAIDVSRHIRQNTPFNGRIAYRTSEYCHDNPLTQLVRHTIEYIRTSRKAGNLLKCDRDMADYVRTIYDITPTYKVNDRQRVINENLKPVKHSFYTAYTPLQQLCLHILRHKGIKYGKSNEKIYGILFDCAWLWEEYLATLLVDKGYTHAVKSLEGGYPFFERGKSRYPDFYSTEKRVILDAKYKPVDGGDNNIESTGGWGQREDQFQLIAYMHTLPSGNSNNQKDTTGALVYPTSKVTSKERFATLYGLGGTYGTIPFLIPQTDNWNAFCNGMANTSAEFLKLIESNISTPSNSYPEEVDMDDEDE